MESARKVTSEIDILPSYFPVPGMGVIPVNAYVLKAQEPVLVDTGAPLESGEFIAALESVIDPDELRWIWLTHPDQDHLGSLMPLLDRLPGVRLITTFLGCGYLSMFTHMSPERVFLLNPGEKLDVGDREVVCLQPPTYDSPATTELFDTKSRALFSSDCFGAMLQTPAAEAADIPADDLRTGQVMWSRVDAPWLHKVDQAKFGAELSDLERLDPSWVLSTHLPPAHGILKQMLATLASVPDAEPLVLPNQAELEMMLTQLTHGAVAS